MTDSRNLLKGVDNYLVTEEIGKETNKSICGLEQNEYKVTSRFQSQSYKTIL